MLTVVPLSASKPSLKVPPEMLTVLPLLASNSSPKVPPVRSSVRPLLARNPKEMIPPEMLTVLSLAPKNKPTAPPEMLTVLPSLALKLSTTGRLSTLVSRSGTEDWPVLAQFQQSEQRKRPRSSSSLELNCQGQAFERNAYLVPWSTHQGIKVRETFKRHNVRVIRAANPVC